MNIYKLVVYSTCVLMTDISFSQSLQDLKKLQSEYEKIQNTKTMNSNNEESLPNQEGLPLKYKMLPADNIFQQENHLKNELDRFFGYDFLIQRDTTNFLQNLSAPSNYVLGPGDELIISLWGETQLRRSYIINKDGKIYDDKVGLLNMNNRTINDARVYLQNQFSEIYSTIRAQSPSTYIDVSLGNLKSINVNFVGLVNYPGVYPIHSLSNLITGLIQIGGVDTLGSLRRITIKRDSKIHRTIDLYNYFVNGNMPSDIYLRDQDIVVVPSRKSTVMIDSAVISPGIYEALQNETVSQMLEYAGGLTYNADSNKISIVKQKSNNKNLYFNLSTADLIPIDNGDRITVYKIFDEFEKVEIIGQVKAPGQYPFYNGMTLLDLFDLTSGFNDSTFIKSVYLDKAQIIRRDSNSPYGKVISIDLENIINNKYNLPLKNLDKIVIHSNNNFFEKENVLLTGEVKIPGSYPLIKDNESLQSFIDRADGLTSKALKNGIEIYRSKDFFDSELLRKKSDKRMLQEENISLPPKTQIINEDIKSVYSQKQRVAWQESSIALMPGDSIVFKEKTSTVFVIGAVYNPGILEFREKKSLKYYISAAGGMTDNADKKGVVVVYPNGIVKPRKWFSSPSVLDGSTIIVNQDEIKEPFNVTEFAASWTSIISSMITVIVLSRQVN